MAYEDQEPARLPGAHGGTGWSTAQAAEASPAAEAAQGPTSPESAEPARAKRLGFARELAETVLLTLVIFVAVRALVVNYRVDGDSMVPNLHNGQYLLVNKAVYFHVDLNALRNLLPGPDTPGQDTVYLFHPPERGDIVVLDPPVRSDKPYIKRVIALPGETVAVRDGKVYVNGEPLEEAYIAEPPRYTYPFNAGEYTVPEGDVFVMGDNRNNSSDSHVFGPVALDHIIGKAFFSYWPFDEAGLIPHERYAQAAGH
jgi:signal peptidase I